MRKNKLLLLLVLLTMLSTRAVAQGDASAMREQMKERIDELTALAPENVKGLNETLKNDVKVYIAQYTEWYNASKSYEDYEEAYDHLGFIINRVNKYLAAYGEFTDNMDKLNALIKNFNADTENKQGYKTFAQNVYNAYKSLSDYDMIALDDDDVEAQKEYDNENYWVEPDNVTSGNIESVANAAENHEYISTYGQFNAFFSQNTKELGSIYLEVAGTGTAESPEDLTAQLRNPNLENAGEQWWGTDWTAFGNSAAEQSGKPFVTYQQVHLPQGYYTLVGYGMDRRGSWTDVLKNNEDWNEYHKTYLFSHLGDEGDSTKVDAFKAKNMALTADITKGTGNISTCEVDGVTYYTPNSMAQYRAWEDAMIAMTGHGHGAVVKFWVWQDEGEFGTLGFAHPWHVDNTWFVADGIQLYYATDKCPDINIDTPIAGETTKYDLKLADGTEDAANWTISPNPAEAGQTVTISYTGTKKVKSVKAVKKGAATIPVTSITLNKTETSIEVGSTETLSVTAVAPDNATDKTYTWKTSDASKATVDQDGKVTAVAAGTVTIYAEANDGSGVKGSCTVTVTPATITVTIDQSEWGWDSFTKDGVTVSAGNIDPMNGNLMNDGTFSTTLGNFTKIVVTAKDCNVSGTGWSGNSSSMTWAGTPTSTVSFSGNINGHGVIQTTIVCTIVPKN